MREELVPKASANLVLCRWARTVDDEVYIQGAGVITSPPSGTPWFLAGVIDCQSEDVRAKGTLEMVDYHTDQPISGFRGTLSVQVEGDGLLHVPLALPLPDVAGTPPGLYGWRIRFGDLEHVTAFVVQEDPSEAA